ncbi:MAG: hypothetical protein P4L79_17485 [Legionella sp.]|uniref:hypothetical protein n=1 Tax=Legionella sp. TaxID=459 RepID=UPI0028435A7E|nr:hypothetical protein [Legionella sp.]
MKVKELIELLKKENQEAIVIMSSDEEGNSFSPFYGFSSQNSYLANSTYSGDVGYNELTKELKEDGYTEEDIISDGEPALVLYPVN